MLHLEEELQEFIDIPDYQGSKEAEYRWTHGETLIFLDLYKVYRQQVGTLRIRSFKQMFEEISKEMRLKTGKNISSTNCENRWRVLERAYNKFIAHNNKTRASRKDFEYSDIMHEILGKKKNIFPEVLLSSETVSAISEVEVSTKKECAVLKGTHNNPSKQSGNTQNSYTNKILKCNLLKQIRQDRQNYYSRRLEQEDKKLEEKVKKNTILEERNSLLREVINNNNIPSLTDFS